MKSGGFLTKDGSLALDAPAPGRAGKQAAAAPRRAPGAPLLRRDLAEDFAQGMGEDGEEFGAKRFKGVRFRLRGGVPRSVVGRVLAGVAVLAALAGFTVVLWEVRGMLLHDPRLAIASSAGVQIEGNSHMSRAQLLSVFGEDVDRNVLTVPLAERRAELEQLPWVEHATVMRLLPNRLRVKVKERVPVAFVRQAGTIGLVDAHGVLMDMEPLDANEGAPVAEHYSFPVVTGVGAADPMTVRAARMKVYARFMGEMAEASKDVSEVDLSDPEDVKALMPSAGADILVHFGEDNFQHRYKVYAAHVGEWKSANPRLASVDMRYEHQVVLEMAKPRAADEAASVEGSAVAAPAGLAVEKTPTSQKRDMGHPADLPQRLKPRSLAVAGGTSEAVPPTKPVTVTAPILAAPVVATPKTHLQTAFDVPSKGAPTKATPVPVVPPR